MAPKTEELRKNPGEFLEQHVDAFNEIVVMRQAYVENLLKSKDKDFSVPLSDVDSPLTFNSLRRGGAGLGSLELRYEAPANALKQAKANVEKAKKNNAKAMIEHNNATDLKEELREHPWTDTAGFGLWAFIQRQVMSSINLTPFNGLNRFEVSDKGLVVYQPFRAVSVRILTYQDLADRNVILSVNPPSYFDLMLGFLGQFRWGRNVPSPWGQLVVDEPGSGRIVGTTVVLWPSEKQKQIEKLLKQLEEADLPYHARLQDVPDVAGQLINYDFEEWRNRLDAWTKDPSKIPDEFLKILYIEPESAKKDKKKAPSRWPKRMGCMLAIFFFLFFIVLAPLWWLLGFIWRRINRFLPRPLRFFVD